MEEQLLHSLPQLAPNAPIASFSYEDPNSGTTLLEDVLSAGVNGTSENIWNAKTAVFSPQHYPPELQQNYTSLATNQDGRLYLMQDGVIKEFLFNAGSTWSSVGNVTTD